jgi:hypothetical protein
MCVARHGGHTGGVVGGCGDYGGDAVPSSLGANLNIIEIFS